MASMVPAHCYGNNPVQGEYLGTSTFPSYGPRPEVLRYLHTSYEDPRNTSNNQPADLPLSPSVFPFLSLVPTRRWPSYPFSPKSFACLALAPRRWALVNTGLCLRSAAFVRIHSFPYHWFLAVSQPIVMLCPADPTVVFKATVT